MKIIGIDQSFSSSALCVIDESTSILDFSVYRSQKELDVFEKCYLVAKNISNYVIKYEPNVIILEGLSFGNLGNRTRDLAGLQFVIITHLRYQLNFNNIIIVPPPTLKKFATGSGRADKTLMIKNLPVNVSELFNTAGFKKTTGLSDLADAYWLACYGIQRI